MELTAPAQEEKIQRYYRLHASIYDATRWTFLLGRHTLLRRLPFYSKELRSVLEAGCGTGHNLRWLAARYPAVRLTGVDVSPQMLERAARLHGRRSAPYRLVQDRYGKDGFRPAEAQDVVLFSYALTMFNPGWKEAILCAKEDLSDKGRIAVVDFHVSPQSWFRHWMRFNHVRMEGHLLPFLQQQFSTEYLSIRSAYFGLWQYVIFIGKK